MRRILWKVAIFLAAAFFVHFPNPLQFYRNVVRWRHPDRLIEPNAASLNPWVDELSLVVPGATPREAIRVIQEYVYENLPYEWDWNIWGNADYIPTVDEALAAGKEDCDGRAVVAASLIRRFGYQADLVTDMAHVWVRTNHGDVMSPGGRPVAMSTSTGLTIQSFPGLQSTRSLAYSLAVFPAYRELILVFTLWLLVMRKGAGATSHLVLLFFMANGLFWIRVGSVNYGYPVVWMQLFGLASWLLGIVVMRVAFLRSRCGKAPSS